MLKLLLSAACLFSAAWASETELIVATRVSPKFHSSHVNAITVKDPNNVDVDALILAIFKNLNVSAVSQACIKDIGGVGTSLKNFAQDFAQTPVDYDDAISSLSAATSAMSAASADCDVPALQREFSAFTNALRWANKTLHNEIIVGSIDLLPKLKELAAAISSGDSQKIAKAFTDLLKEWTHIEDITSICKGDKQEKACKIVDGILKILQQISADIAPCRDAIVTTMDALAPAIVSFKAKRYDEAVDQFAVFLDDLAKALGNDACGLKSMEALIEQLAPKLAKAEIVIDADKVAHILVGSIDVLDTIFDAIECLEKRDYTGFGIQMGILLQELRASGCQTKACLILQALLSTAQIESGDIMECSHFADLSFTELDEGIKMFKEGKYQSGLNNVGEGVNNLANAVDKCHVKDVAGNLANLAKQLNSKSILPAIIDKAATILVDGADITHQVDTLIANFASDNFQGVGSDMVHLADTLNADFPCHSVACEMLVGFLRQAGKALSHVDLKACEENLHAVDVDLVEGARLFGDKDYALAIRKWSKALIDTKAAVSPCGLQDEVDKLQKEAGVLSIANITKGEIESLIIVHGKDIFEDFNSIFGAFKNHDVREAGKSVQTLVTDLNSWTSGHVCESDFCYVVIGIMQYMGAIEGDLRACTNDFKNAFTNFTHGVKDLTSGVEGHFWHYKRNKGDIKRGVGELGTALLDVANGVKDCHLEELAEILEKLGAKLGIAPEISFLEMLVHILIDSVDIARDVGNACVDYENDNWAGFGFNLAKLIKTLLKLEADPVLNDSSTGYTLAPYNAPYQPSPFRSSVAEIVKKHGIEKSAVVISAIA